VIDILDLSSEQADRLEGIRRFAAQYLAPHAATYDREEFLPDSFVNCLCDAGYLCAILPTKWGGGGWDAPSYGLLHSEIGGELSSAAAIITVHDMVAHAVLHWGTEDQKRRWLPDLASGRLRGCLAVTEETAGSDIRSVQAIARREGNVYVLNGVKKWITGGQFGTLFLVLARIEDKPTAFIVDKGCGGISAHPVRNMLGFRAAMLAEIHLDDCVVPAENVLGRVNLGVEGPIQSALDLGRYTVACNAAGLAAACLGDAASYAVARTQFRTPIAQHQLVAGMIADMAAGVRAARLLCWQAGRDRQAGRPRAMLSTLEAKYFASRMATAAAADAVQIMGSRGCSEEAPAARRLRDSKILEIIEGSSQIQQILISQLVCKEMTAKPTRLW
jgi:glutaryl-CoA dehydrogenase (non-decarboxylating)